MGGLAPSPAWLQSGRGNRAGGGLQNLTMQGGIFQGKKQVYFKSITHDAFNQVDKTGRKNKKNSRQIAFDLEIINI